MCGEHTDADSVSTSASGSSPHVRGALVAAAEYGDDNGIIPACAGSTRR